MIISPTRRFAFVHIPKTGGTSFAQAYEDRAAADDILIGDTPKARRRKGRLDALDVPGRLWKHSTLGDVGTLVPDDYFVFTMVRNPWDRIVSYYHWLREQGFDHPAVLTAKRMPFDAFLRDPIFQNSVRENAYVTYVAGCDGGDRCAAYVRLEHPVDFEPVQEYLGFSLSIPWLNRSNRDHNWRESYDVESFDIVTKIAHQDILKFGYDTML